MKKLLFILISFLISETLYSQTYNSKQLKTIAEIWGECYLFHPSVIRSNQHVNWEEELVKFLPLINQDLSHEEFIQLINTKLISSLNDPLTYVQKTTPETSLNSREYKYQSNVNYDYYTISEEMLMSQSLWIEFDSIISEKKSQKALVLDLRINSELALNPHEKSYFERIASLLIDSPISMGSSVSREHFGWDEFNDWWYYEQRWKIESNSTINPLKMDAPMIQYQYPEIDLNLIETIHRPIYFVVNKSFISYYYPLLKSLKLYRSDTYIIFENTGNVFTPWYLDKIKYDFNDFEFVFNPSFTINNNSVDLNFDYSTDNIESNNIEQIIEDISQRQKIGKTNFNFDIVQKPYSTSEETLSNEERILGIIKTWTIVKYFYAHHNLASVNWDDILQPYLSVAQNCNNDKEYYELIQNMMSKLNDSHVSTFHPSIFDYSKLFVAPIQFEWIENKVIITAIIPEFIGKFNIQASDEILSIDGKSIQQIIKDNKQKISASNNQSFYNNVINPGNFVDALNVPMKISIKRNNKEQELEIPRTVQIFEFFMQIDKRPAFEIKENNIGYLNLSALTNSYELEKELRKMKNTQGLIIDLRNGYPTYNYLHFIEMLANKTFKGRIDETPIVFANKNNAIVFEESQNKYQTDSSFIYKNPVAVLIDKSMVSRPEDIAIELKELENIFFVGEQTQGTDGEMTKISLPRGGETSFTGQRILFANGDQFQGIGITPDYEVEKTVKGVKQGNDEILDKALKIIAKKISEK
ncbi:MAG: hypothetical protein KAR57_01375 [Bacteroidales bacterium]|nr:hypothetical protein [Bacteroidales bacterium]